VRGCAGAAGCCACAAGKLPIAKNTAHQTKRTRMRPPEN
jgi:hypothetical protein